MELIKDIQKTIVIYAAQSLNRKQIQDLIDFLEDDPLQMVKEQDENLVYVISSDETQESEKYDWDNSPEDIFLEEFFSQLRSLIAQETKVYEIILDLCSDYPQPSH